MEVRVLSSAPVSFLLLIALLFAVPDAFHGQDESESYLHNFFPRIGYGGEFASIKNIDFRNSTIRVMDGDTKKIEFFNLKGGECRNRDKLTSRWIRLNLVHFLKSHESAVQRVVLFFDTLYVGGTSKSGGMIQVLELENGRLIIAQQIDFDADVVRPGPNYDFDPTSNQLTIRASHYFPGDAHCCISGVDLVTFQWTGKRFEKVSSRTVLSDYGKSKKEEAKRKEPPR